MILTGWKEIANYLRYGIRTVQRWEGRGLPVKRVTDSPRSAVVADSDELDAWILHRNRLPNGAPQDLLENLQRARELRHEVERNRKEFQRRLELFREELAEFRAKRRPQRP